MTAPTPEQMRALADSRDEVAATWSEYTNLAAKFREDASALRAAADRFEAVRSWADEHYHHFQEISELDAILNGASGD